ncbi:MAG: hypothetical protein ABIC68_01045 [Candidatus Omnitrophota bacterium]
MKNSKIELAQFINLAKEVDELPDNIKRVYLGSEFCENILPDKNELLKIIRCCLKKNISYTLVTPYCSDHGIDRVKKLIKFYPDNEEIVVNDPGILDILIEKKKWVLVFGRVLTKNIKDPRIHGVNIKQMKLFQKSNIESTLLHNFLDLNNILRVEIDNVLQGYREDIFKKNVKFTLHYPYVYITASRNCIFNENIHGKRYLGLELKKCKKVCLKNPLISRYKSIALPIFHTGKASFYKNDVLKIKTISPNLNRIVFSKFSSI